MAIAISEAASPWLTTAQAAEYLSVAEVTLHKWRAADVGPAFARQGRIVRYRREELDKWLNSGS